MNQFPRALEPIAVNRRNVAPTPASSDTSRLNEVTTSTS
jgi:hypothetical protein